MPYTFGIPVQSFTVTTDYKDVAKVEVTASAIDLNLLASLALAFLNSDAAAQDAERARWPVAEEESESAAEAEEPPAEVEEPAPARGRGARRTEE